MIVDINQLMAVTGSLICLFILPFLPIAYRLIRPAHWPRVILCSLIMGTSLQAVTGILWTNISGKWPYGEILLFALAWGSILFWVYKRAPDYGFGLEVWEDNDLGRSHLFLVIILCLAFVVRSIHPLQVAYLGQSDSYTHLNYLHNIVESGKLINPVYPSGYHWILALPVLLFSLDPYNIARFAGAFFGVGLILGIYVLLEAFFNRRTAVFGSFCGACFPLMNLLMKTGVGAFANQFGLMLIPAVILMYWYTVTSKGETRVKAGLLSLTLCGLVASVPMMLFHILIVFACERCLALLRVRAPGKWFVTTTRVTLITAPALLLLLFHLSQVPPGQRFRTANTLVDYGSEKKDTEAVLGEKVESAVKSISTAVNPKLTGLVISSPYFKLVLDYLSVKRKNGFGNIYVNVLGAVLVLLFFSVGLAGFIHNNSSNLLIGLWGGITSVQAFTGILQFSSYQREGWSLLIATCCLSGIIAAKIYQLGSKSLLFRAAVICCMGIGLYWTVLHPPRHTGIPSAAEGELIESLRFLGQKKSKRQQYCDRNDVPLCSLASALNWQQPVTIVSRVLTGWSNQGEITENVVQRNSGLDIEVVRREIPSDFFKISNQYLTFVDNTLRSQKELFGGNGILLDYLNALDDELWNVQEFQLSERLTAYVAISEKIQD